MIAEDAVGDNDPTHAAVTRQYLEQRFVRFLTAKQVVSQLQPSPPPSEGGQQLPAAIVSGSEIQDGRSSSCSVTAPRDGVTPVFAVLPADERSAAAAVESSRQAFGEWQEVEFEQRRSLVAECAQALEKNSEVIVKQIVSDIGKPLTDARGEVEFASALVRAAHGSCREAELSVSGNGWRAIRRPNGVVLTITPWNNPLAIAVGRLCRHSSTETWLSGNPLCTELESRQQPCAASFAICRRELSISSMVTTGSPSG